MTWKNTLLKTFCKTFSKRSKERKSPERILIVSTTALGDTLWSTPAIESLKKSFPKSFLAVLTSPIGYEVLKTNPWIDQLFLFKKPFLKSFFSLWRSLRKKNFDTIILFHASQRLVFPLLSLLGADRIIGTAGINKGLDDLFTNLLTPKYQHEILRRLELIQSLGAIIHTERLSFIPEPSTPSLPLERLIILHPGAKDRFKQWPVEHFAAVGRYLSEKYGYTILISGNLEENEIMKKLSSQIPGSQCMPPSSLHVFAKILQKSHLLVTNDSGPLHMAAALNCKAIAIFAATDPNLCGPYKMENIKILAKSPTCSPCFKKNCRLPFCLFQISPEEVIHAAEKLLV